MTTPTPPLYVDRFDLSTLLTTLTAKGGLSALTKASGHRFWSSTPRVMTDGTRDIVEIRYAGPRLVNYLSFKTARFPHIVAAEYLGTDVAGNAGVWQPFTVGGASAIGTVTDSVPSVVSGQINPGTGHPQHTAAPGHWVPVNWNVNAVECTRVRLVLARTQGVGPTDLSGRAIAYSLGIRDWQTGYRINSPNDIPRTGIIETDEATFGSSMDLLGSRVVFSTKRDSAQNMLTATTGKFWRSEPQPVSYAVVSTYADTRDANGDGTLIDRFWLDPLTVGPHLNLYYSNDDPSGAFEPSSEHIPYGALTQVGAGVTSTSERLIFHAGTETVAAVTVNNDAVMLDSTKPWWVAMQINPQWASDDTNDRTIMEFGSGVLAVTGSTLTLVTDNGEVYTIPLPPYPTNADVKVFLAYIPDDEGVGKGYHVYWKVGDAEPTHLIGDIFRPIQRVASLTFGGSLAEFSMSAMIVKQDVLTDAEIDAFDSDPSGYVLGPTDRSAWPGTAGNAVLRFHPSGITPEAPTGLVGGSGDFYGGLTWTPIGRDLTLKQGYIYLPPTKARFWKFEITNLVPEHYEVFVPIRREVKMFRSATVEQWHRLTAASSSRDAKYGNGITTMLSLARQNRTTTSVGLLGLLGTDSTQSYSPTEVLYVRDPGAAQQVATKGWVWRFQPWHIGTRAPRFVNVEKHTYEKVVMDHQTKVGFFAGIKSLRAFRLDYLAEDDTEQYLEHFHDAVHVAEATGVYWPDGSVVSAAYSAEVVSETFQSVSTLIGLQFAAAQTDPQQVLEDEFVHDATKWMIYGDASGQIGPTGAEIVRGYYHRTYGQIETEPEWRTYGAMEGHLYSEIEGGLVSGLVGGGIESEEYMPSAAGRVYAAIRVSAADTLTMPIQVQIVDKATGTVLAEAEEPVLAGETTTVWVGYTPGTVGAPLTWGDMEAFGTYGDLEGTTYLSHEARAITGPVFVRALQIGPSDDTFRFRRISLYDDPITWEFSNDGGTTWYDGSSIRNNINGVVTFPDPGKELRWRLRMRRPGSAVSALHIRPWYYGHTAPVTSQIGLLNHGPNMHVADHYPTIEEDPMWRLWNRPIPRSFDNPPPVIEGPLVDIPEPIIVPVVPESVQIVAEVSENYPTGDSATAYVNFLGNRTDQFNRTDNPTSLSGTGALPWVYWGPGTAEVINNEATFTGLDGVNPTGAVTDLGSPDTDVGLTFTDVNAEVGMIFRGDTVGQNYWVATRTQLRVYIAGVPTTVASYSTAPAGARYAVALNGNSIILTRNGVEIANITDARLNNQTYGGLWRV